jgi:hypothetical protein
LRRSHAVAIAIRFAIDGCVASLVRPVRRGRILERFSSEVPEERPGGGRVAGRLEGDPIGLGFQLPRDSVVERAQQETPRDQGQQRERHRPRLVETATPPCQPGDSAEEREQQEGEPGNALPDVLACVVSELMGHHDPDLPVVEASVEQRVPEEDAPTRAETYSVRVRGTGELARLLDDDLHRLGVLALGKPHHVTLQLRRSRALVDDEVRVEEGEEQREPGEDGDGREPPRASEAGRQRHRDQEPETDEEELGGEQGPALDEPVEVAGLPDVVTSQPPELQELEGQLREPDQCEPEHPEQHPGADAAGG